MRKANEDIKKYARESGVFLYQLAHKLGMNDGNFSRMLRFEIPEPKKTEILSIINSLAKEQKKC